jgi:hypothetical protein
MQLFPRLQQTIRFLVPWSKILYVIYIKVISDIPQANMKHTLWITVEECEVWMMCIKNLTVSAIKWNDNFKITLTLLPKNVVDFYL